MSDSITYFVKVMGAGAGQEVRWAIGVGGEVVLVLLVALNCTPIRLPSVICMRVGGNKHVSTGFLNDKCVLSSASYVFVYVIPRWPDDSA